MCAQPDQQCQQPDGALFCCEGRSRCCSAAQLGLDQDVCVADDTPCPLPCPDGNGQCTLGTFCQTTPDGDLQCLDNCPAVRRCGFNACCAPGSVCQQDSCAAGDLVVDAAALQASAQVRFETLDAAACNALDGCAAGTGDRKLLTFSLQMRNTGTADVLVGPPTDPLLFGESRCSHLPTLPGFVGWRVMDAGGQELASGSIAASCIRDDADGQAFSSCTYQGLSAGGTSRNVLLDTCNFVDVTNLPEGDYQLEVELNAAGSLLETDTTNNTAVTPFTIGGACVGGVPCGATCCPNGFVCSNSECLLPDLTVDQNLLASTVRLTTETFAQNDCAIMEGCLRAGGERRLLRFSTSTPNVGTADFFVGRPEDSPNAEWSACHGHYHYHEYAHYRLLDQQGQEVVRGAKQAFCLTDIERVLPDAPPAQYGCTFQGITRGWADIYSSGLDCQWVDVTGLGEGDYTLEIEVNPNRFIPELDFSNNVATVSVHVPQDPNVCVPQPEICWDGIDQDCVDGADNGCAPITGNATCASALNISGNTLAQVTLQNPPAGEEIIAGCGGSGGQAVFSINVAFPQLAYISTHGSSLDTTISVRGGTCASAEVACVDDTCLTSQGHWAGMLQEGPNLVVVRAKDPVEGAIQFKVELAACADGQLLDFNGVHAGTTLGQPNTKTTTCRNGPTAGPEERWYFTTCPGTTRADFSTCNDGTPGNSFDTLLEVSQGSCRGNPVAGACNDDDQSQMACPGVPFASHLVTDLSGSGAGDGLWFLLVEAYSDAVAGPYQLSTSLTPL